MTPEDEQRLLSIEPSKHLYQNELSNHSEGAPNPYLTPIRHSNETVNDSKLSPGASRPQSYLNMDGNVQIPDKDTQQDLLFFSVENTPGFVNETSKVTYF